MANDDLPSESGSDGGIVRFPRNDNKDADGNKRDNPEAQAAIMKRTSEAVLRANARHLRALPQVELPRHQEEGLSLLTATAAWAGRRVTVTRCWW